MSFRGFSLAFSFLLLIAAPLLYAVSRPAPAGSGAARQSVQYREDFNGDGRVQMADVIALLILGRDSPQDPRADYNGDGGYAVSDVITLLLNIRRGRLSPVEPEERTLVIQGIRMVFIPAGCFLMGSEKGYFNERPADSVWVSAFWIGETEVTQRRYAEVTGENPSFFAGTGDNPVERVSWYDAARFCNSLSTLAGFDPCYDPETWECDFGRNGFRLPREAEWEYACRAGTQSEYNTGDTESRLSRAGWYFSNSSGTTHPAGRKEPNAWGLYDMHGNVWEWCGDTWPGCLSPGDTSSAYGSGLFRILRGGAWDYQAFFCRSAFRNYERAGARYACKGFRVVRGYF